MALNQNSIGLPMDPVTNSPSPIVCTPIEKDYAKQVIYGPTLEPEEYISLYDGDKFEQFIKEWVDRYLGHKYVRVLPYGSSNDKGRDIVAYKTDQGERGPWVNYQCKAYDSPLAPTEFLTELGKLCYYTFIKDYSVPDEYWIVASKGVGPGLADLIANPDRLRNRLIKDWDRYCKPKISSTPVPLSNDLKQYIEAFNFGIINHISPGDIVEQHKGHPHHYLRFGRLKLKRPTPEELTPPDEIAVSETVYVRQLFEVYSEFTKTELSTKNDLVPHTKLGSHFDRSRVEFYTAETLRRSARDVSADGCDFDEAKHEIHIAIADIIDDEHPNGFTRLKRTTEYAGALPMLSHVLSEQLNSTHKRGICHQLANEEKIKWVS